jgi:hypothetical protein
MVKPRGDMAIGEASIEYGKITTVIPYTPGYAMQFPPRISDTPVQHGKVCSNGDTFI